MPQYVLKVLVDLEARDDLDARQAAAAIVRSGLAGVSGVREIVLHSNADHKSIRLNPDGSFADEWRKGGAPSPGASARS
jgi:hypothetical protein